MSILLGEKSGNSIMKSAHQFDICPTTYWIIVKKTASHEVKLHRAVQPLIDDHREQRMKLCHWLLNQKNTETFVLIHRI